MGLLCSEVEGTEREEWNGEGSSLQRCLPQTIVEQFRAVCLALRCLRAPGQFFQGVAAAASLRGFSRRVCP